MKNLKLFLLMILCITPCIFMLSACKEENTTPPPAPQPTVLELDLELLNGNYTLDKSSTSEHIYGSISTTYGSNLNLTKNDFKVTATLSDSTTKVLTNNEYQLTSNIPNNTATPAGNYTLSFEYNDNLKLTVAVNIAKQSIDLTNVEWNYSSALVYNGSAQQVQLTNIPDTAKVTYSSTYSATVPGSYIATATVEAKDAANYIGTRSLTLNWEIAKANLKIIAKNVSILYGEEPKNNGCDYQGFVKNENSSDLSGILAYSFNYSLGNNAGTYAVTPQGLTSDNYNIEFVSGVLTVNKAVANTSTINSTNITLTQSTFEETGENISVALSNFTCPAGVKLDSFTGNVQKDPGNYTAVATFVCSNTDNFESFEPIVINLDWSIQAKVEPTPSASLPEDLELSISGCSLYIEDFVDMSDYYIAKFEDLSSDMVISSDSFNITIITANDVTVIDEYEEPLSTNEEVSIQFSEQYDLGDYAGKITINYMDTDFVIYILFSDSTL